MIERCRSLVPAQRAVIQRKIENLIFQYGEKNPSPAGGRGAGVRGVAKTLQACGALITNSASAFKSRLASLRYQ
jgi:hypothetical protein